MQNSIEYLKKCNVPQVTLKMNPEKVLKDPNHCAKNAQDFGKDDYRAIILRNMGRSTDEKNVERN
jgi:hypothetical protein